MEMVSASKMRRAQAQALATRPYTQALKESLAKLANLVQAGLHPFLQENHAGYPIAIVISTDKGLCGGLNQNLFKAALHWIKENPTGKLVLIGKKSVKFAKVYGLPVHAQFTDLPDPIAHADTLAVTTLATAGFLEQTFTSVAVIYMDFVSTLVQKVTQAQLLPLPKTMATATTETPLVHTKLTPEYIFEPSAQEILNDLLQYYLENTIHQSFLEAKASEHSARMVAMKNASENAKELVSELQLQFNKSRQEHITSELLDITTAILAQTR